MYCNGPLPMMLPLPLTLLLGVFIPLISMSSDQHHDKAGNDKKSNEMY